MLIPLLDREMEQGPPLHIILNSGCILVLYRGAAKVSGPPEAFRLGAPSVVIVFQAPLLRRALGIVLTPPLPPPWSYSTIFGTTLMVTLQNH